MKQTDLNRAVAHATGETVARIARMGFGLMIMPAVRAPRPQSGTSLPIRLRGRDTPVYRPQAQAA